MLNSLTQPPKHLLDTYVKGSEKIISLVELRGNITVLHRGLAKRRTVVNDFDILHHVCNVFIFPTL